MDILKELRAFCPWNQQEAADRDALLALLEGGQAPYGREDPAHWTASAWVVSPDRRQVLLAYHTLYDSWSWLWLSGRSGRRAVWRRSVPCPGTSTLWRF